MYFGAYVLLLLTEDFNTINFKFKHYIITGFYFHGSHMFQLKLQREQTKSFARY